MPKGYKVGDTTYQFPDDYDDATVQSILTEQGVIGEAKSEANKSLEGTGLSVSQPKAPIPPRLAGKESVPVRDAFAGFGAGAIKTGVGLYNVGRRIQNALPWAPRVPPVSPSIEALTHAPESKTGQIAQGVEQAAEYLIPGTKGVAGPLASAAVAGAQSGADPESMATAAATHGAAEIIPGIIASMRNAAPSANGTGSVIQPSDIIQFPFRPRHTIGKVLERITNRKPPEPVEPFRPNPAIAARTRFGGSTAPFDEGATRLPPAKPAAPVEETTPEPFVPFAVRPRIKVLTRYGGPTDEGTSVASRNRPRSGVNRALEPDKPPAKSEVATETVPPAQETIQETSPSLDDVARGQAGKPFSKLTPEQQQSARDVHARLTQSASGPPPSMPGRAAAARKAAQDLADALRPEQPTVIPSPPPPESHVLGKQLAQSKKAMSAAARMKEGGVDPAAFRKLPQEVQDGFWKNLEEEEGKPFSPHSRKLTLQELEQMQ